MSKIIIIVVIFISGLLCLSGCNDKSKIRDSGKIQILTTTTIIADVVVNVCENKANVECILPPGASPHGFEMVPRDMLKIDKANILFINGGGLEKFLEKVINRQDVKNKTISLSDHVKFLHKTDLNHENDHHELSDPHVWLDPNNVILWVNEIESALCKKDSVNSTHYKKNAQAYRLELQQLDKWITNQFDTIYADQRKIVTDHRMLGYYANRYGLEQIGTILPGFSSLAEPSAREIARLQEEIRKLNVKAIMVGMNMNPALAVRITKDTGTKLVRFYGGSLSEKGGPADTYLKYMRFNTRAIVEALN